MSTEAVKYLQQRRRTEPCSNCGQVPSPAKPTQFMYIGTNPNRPQPMKIAQAHSVEATRLILNGDFVPVCQACSQTMTAKRYRPPRSLQYYRYLTRGQCDQCRKDMYNLVPVRKPRVHPSMSLLAILRTGNPDRAEAYVRHFFFLCDNCAVEQERFNDLYARHLIDRRLVDLDIPQTPRPLIYRANRAVPDPGQVVIDQTPRPATKDPRRNTRRALRDRKEFVYKPNPPTAVPPPSRVIEAPRKMEATPSGHVPGSDRYYTDSIVESVPPPPEEEYS